MFRNERVRIPVVGYGGQARIPVSVGSHTDHLRRAGARLGPQAEATLGTCCRVWALAARQNFYSELHI